MLLRCRYAVPSTRLNHGARKTTLAALVTPVGVHRRTLASRCSWQLESAKPDEVQTESDVAEPDVEPVEPSTAAKAEPQQEAKSETYTEEMQAKMGTTLTYRHELGMNYNRITPDLIVGSCLQTVEDVDKLVEKENVKTVFCLQEDSDMAYFSLDVTPIQQRCAERGIKHVRYRIRDFDPYDLRRKLPKAVSRLAREHDPAKGTVYIHCTAGLGRAPATALAYLYWVRGMQLDEAYDMLTGLRRCSPKIDSIRSATADLLLNVAPVKATIAVHRFGSAKKIQVAGLDYGWHHLEDMQWDPETHRFVMERMLFPGKYQYKLVVDGVWTYSADHQTVKDGDHINNTLEVIAPLDARQTALQLRYLTKGTVLSAEEKEELSALLCPWSTHHSGAGPREVPAALRSVGMSSMDNGI